MIESLRTLVRSFRGKRVLVVGDVMLDEYLIGEVHRISPEAPVPVLDLSHRTHVAGGAGNVASNIASLGGAPVLIGITGSDENAQTLRAILESHGVRTGRLITSDERPTTTKTRIVSGQQQIVRVDREEKAPLPFSLGSAALHAFHAEIRESDACILSDYGKGLLADTLCQEMIATCAALGKPVAVDPKGYEYARYAGSTVVTPNLREAEHAARLPGRTGDQLAAIAARLHEVLLNSAVLITQGADGMTLFCPGEQPVHAPALAREVFDVTGAGDTVAATLTLALAAGAALSQGMMLANVAASVVVQKAGTATATPQELLEACEGHSSSIATARL